MKNMEKTAQISEKTYSRHKFTLWFSAILTLLILCDAAVLFAATEATSRNKISYAAVRIPKGQSQLFLDDELIADQDNVSCVWHQFKKNPANPLIERTKPEGSIVLYGSVIREPDSITGGATIFKMWYWAGGYDENEKWTTWIAYAKSRDGIKWEKPNLGIYELHGSRENNIVFPAWLKVQGTKLKHFNGMAGTIRDPNLNVLENERYKMVIPVVPEGGGGLHNRWIVTLVSPDGLHWKVNNVLKNSSGDRTCFVWDPYRKLYALYPRAYHSPPGYKKKAIEQKWPKFYGGNARAVAIMTSKDFKKWTEPELLMYPDSNDPDGTQIYGMYAFPYQGKWIGLWQNHRSLADIGTINIGIAHSRDGTNWHRVRATEHIMLPLGDIGQWDRFNQGGSISPVQVGDELWFYYSGRTYRHGEYRGKDTGPGSSQGGIRIGLATIRLDGFCSMQASFDGGHIITVPLLLPKGELFLNAKANWGEIVVEILNLQGNIINEMKSEPIVSDGVRLPVKWPKGKELAELAGKKVKLKFTLKNALLFSWKVD